MSKCAFYLSFLCFLWEKCDRYEMLKGTEREAEKREKGEKGAKTMKRRRTE